MRKIICGLLAAAGVSVLSAASVWDFSVEQKDWNKLRNASAMRENGALKLMIKAKDSGIINENVNVHSQLIKAVRVTYKAQDFNTKLSPGQLFFASEQKGFDGNCFFRTPTVIADGKVHTMEITEKLLHGDPALWRNAGRIKSFRLDLTDNAPGIIYLYKVELVLRKPPADGMQSAAGIEWDLTAAQGNWKKFRNASGAHSSEGITITIQGPDSGIINDQLNVPVSRIKGFKVYYKASGFTRPTSPGQIYFANENHNFGACYFRTPSLVPNGQRNSWEVLLKDLQGNIADWHDGKTLKALRLDLTDSAPGTIVLEKVEILFNTSADLAKKVQPKSVKSPLAPPPVPPAPWAKRIERKLGNHMPDKPLELPENYFSGMMCNYPQRGEVCENGYIRHKFNLNFVPEKAYLQFTADDAVTALYVNGKLIDGIWSESWRDVNTAEIASALKQGENTLAMCYKNIGGLGGVLYELSAVRGKKCVSIVSGKDAQIAYKASDKWMFPSDRASNWTTPEIRACPPGNPWSGVVLPYTNYLPNSGMIEVSRFDVQSPAATKDFSVRFTLEAKPELKPDEKLSVNLVNEHGRVFSRQRKKISEFAPEKTADGKWRFELQNFDLTEFGGEINGKVQITMRHRDSVNGEKSFTIPARPLPDIANIPSAEIVDRGSDSVITVNGQPYYPATLTLHSYELNKIYRDGFEGAGSPVNNCSVRLGGRQDWWIGDDTYDFEVVDRNIAQIIEKYPNALISPWIWCHPGKWYEKKYPERISRNSNGGFFDYYISSVTFSGPEYRRDAAKAVQKLVEYCEKYYGSRIIFYNLMGGVSCEWQGWESHTLHKKNALHDYSKTAQRDFVNYARERYNLDMKMPQYKERFAADNALFRNPKRDAAAILYDEYYSVSIAECINIMADAVRAGLHGRKKLIGAYYGYSFEYGDYAWCLNSGGHNALNKVLQHGGVDMFFSPPSYTVRAIGEPSADMKAFGSVKLHGKFSVLEDDTRTNLSFAAGVNQTLTDEQSISVMRRNYGMALTRLSPLSLLPIDEGLNFDLPQLREDIRSTVKAGTFLYGENRTSGVETAFVLDEESIKFFSPTNERAPLANYFHRYNQSGVLNTFRPGAQVISSPLWAYQRNQLSQFGAGCDYLLLNDVPQAAKKYKLWIIAGAMEDSPRLRAALDALSKEKVTIVLLYGAGFITDQSELDCRSISKYLKMNIKPIAPGATRLAVADRKFGSYAVSEPRFAVVDRSAKTLGKYLDGGAVGMAEKQFGKARLIFCGTTEMDEKFLADMLKSAGGHLYTAYGDVCFAGYGTVAIHSRRAGKKRVVFPEAVDVWDVFENKIVARNVREYTFEMPALDSKVLVTGKDLSKLETK